MNRRIVFSGLLLLILVISACSLPTSAGTLTPTETNKDLTLTHTSTVTTSTATVPSTATIEPSVTAQPTVTSTITVTSIPCNWGEFISDVTYPDDTVITAGQQFVKTWRLKNVGTCSWTSAYKVIFVSGAQMGAAASTQLTTGVIAPGGTIDVSLTLTAPNEAGTYTGYFKLADGSSTPFGIGSNASGSFYVQIVSEEEDSGLQINVPSININRTLKLTSPYMTGDDVTNVQKRLIELGYDPGTADGTFGPKTAAAVKAFQSAKGLTVDGIVGTQTWAKLFE
jgi:hypothetical protein